MDLRDLAERAGVEPSRAETDRELLHRLSEELDLGLDRDQLRKAVSAVHKNSFSEHGPDPEEAAALAEVRDLIESSFDGPKPSAKAEVDAESSARDSQPSSFSAEPTPDHDLRTGHAERESKEGSGTDDGSSPDGESGVEPSGGEPTKSASSSGSTSESRFAATNDDFDLPDAPKSLTSYFPGSTRHLAAFVVLIVIVGTIAGAGVITESFGVGGADAPDSADGAFVTTTGTAAGTATQTGPPSSPRAEGAASSNSNRSRDEGTELASTSDGNSVDSDGDGLSDSLERRLGLSPRYPDTDGDGLNDSVEYHGPTDPFAPDTDNDSLEDGWEVNNGLNATNPDTDGDGVDDPVELENGLNPLEVDTDGDGLTDRTEFNGPTNATNPDTDNDGLEDGGERELGAAPTNPDTDDDGLGDGAEVEHGTNLTNPDTDGDTLLDGWEVANEADGGAALPEADPLHKDLYVQVSRSREARVFSSSDRAHVRAAFADMQVRNPDGDDGIAVHFDPYPFRIPVREEIQSESHMRDVLEEYSPNDYLGDVEGVGDRDGIYHHVMLVRTTDTANIPGVAQAPGHNVVVDAANTSTHGGSIPYRDRMVVRGLLQNIVGEPDSDIQDPDHPRFTQDGWMKYGTGDLRVNENLPDPIKRRISRDGFSE